MTLTHTAGAFDGRRLLRLDIPACLAFAALGALVLAPRIGSLSGLVFLLAGGALLASGIDRSARALARYWYVFLLPAYCLISSVWSIYPGETIKSSLQLAATIAIGIVIASRVSPATLVRTLFWLLLLSLCASALFGRVRDDTGAWVGLFGSKNAFAGVVSMFMLTAVALLADRGGSLLQKGAALAGLAASVPLLLLAQSAGALVTIIPAMGVTVLVLASAWLTYRQKIALAVVLAFAVAATALAAFGYWDDLLNTLLSTTGKDTTLTGRTDLWDAARRLIEDSPVLGVGYRAFWVQGHGPAETLWLQFGIASRSGFNFHNTYLSNAVEVGILGVVIQTVLFAMAILAAALWCMRSPSPANAFFLGFLVKTLASSFVEVLFFFPFGLPTLMAIFALAYGLRDARPSSARNVR